jgi:Domain of unknown function (DUF4349)
MRAFLIALCTTIALISLTACGGGSNGGSSSAASGEKAGPPRLAGPDQAGGADGTVAKGTQVRLAPAQAIVYTANLTVRVADVTGAGTRAKEVVAAAGGYVGNETSADAPGSRPSATITFKIPSAKYPAVLDRLGSSFIGRRESLHQQADDVTQEVADVASRVQSAKAALASFRALLSKTDSVSEIIRIEQEISGREADLESLQARQKSLSAQTSFATVTMRLEGTAEARRSHKEPAGFAGGIRSGWRAFTAFLGGLALVVGWLLPFLALAAVVGAPALWLWRRRRGAAAGKAGSA